MRLIKKTIYLHEKLLKQVKEKAYRRRISFSSEIDRVLRKVFIENNPSFKSVINST